MDFVNQSIFASTGLAPLDSWYSNFYFSGHGNYNKPYITTDGTNFYVARTNPGSILNSDAQFVRINSEGHWDSIFKISKNGPRCGSAHYEKKGTKLYCATTGTRQTAAVTVLNEDQTLVWSKLIQDSTSSFANCDIVRLRVDGNGNVYVITRMQFVTNARRAGVVCFNSSGVVQWSKVFSKSGYHCDFTDIALDPAGSVSQIFICATTTNTSSSTDTTAHLVTLNSDGTVDRQNEIGGVSGNLAVYSIFYTALKIYVCGYYKPTGSKTQAWMGVYNSSYSSGTGSIIDNPTLYDATNTNDLVFYGVNYDTTQKISAVGFAGTLSVEFLADKMVIGEYSIATTTNLDNQYQITGFVGRGAINAANGTYYGEKATGSLSLFKNIKALSRPRTWSDVSIAATSYTAAGVSPTLLTNTLTVDNWTDLITSDFGPVITSLSASLPDGFVSNASNSY